MYFYKEDESVLQQFVKNITSLPGTSARRTRYIGFPQRRGPSRGEFMGLVQVQMSPHGRTLRRHDNRREHAEFPQAQGVKNTDAMARSPSCRRVTQHHGRPIPPRHYLQIPRPPARAARDACALCSRGRATCALCHRPCTWRPFCSRNACDRTAFRNRIRPLAFAASQSTCRVAANAAAPSCMAAPLYVSGAEARSCWLLPQARLAPPSSATSHASQLPP